jgi:ABC-2 type transport system ATP-binding protein
VPPAAVEISDLVVRYGARVAVNGLSLTAPVGVVTALVGPNGAGKTSTVEVCAGLRPASSGTVRLLGEPIGAPDLRRRVGVMLQDGGLYTSAAPLPFLSYVASLYETPADPAELLRALGIDPALRTPIRRLSGGEQQRVKCAAALIGRPELVFLDEPTVGLDPVARRGIHERVRQLTEAGTSVVLTTHLMDDVERLASHVIVMAQGRVIREGNVDQLVGAEDSVTFKGPAHCDLTDLRAALPDTCSVTEEHPGVFRVSGSTDPMVLSAVASWSAQHGGRTGDLAIGRRSLEDVIVELVGEPL